MTGTDWRQAHARLARFMHLVWRWLSVRAISLQLSEVGFGRTV